MEIFLDTANIKEIQRFVYLIDGVTTNPTLIAQEQAFGNFEDLIKEIARIVERPVSVEAVSQTAAEIIRESRDLAALSPHVVVKVPMTLEGLKATTALQAEGIRTNITLVFSVNQAILAAKAGATYVSVFVGRLDDIGHSGMAVVEDAVRIFQTYGWSSKVITASVRHPLHVIAAANAGSHAITIPPKVLEMMAHHNLTDSGLQRFLEDWKKVTGR